MAKQMGVAGDVSYTCETAAHFWLLHVLSRWEKFLADAGKLRTEDCVKVGSAEISPSTVYLLHFISAQLCNTAGRKPENADR